MTTPAAPEFTDEQLLAGISNALNARDFDAVVAILRVLAVQAPDTAQTIYDAIVHGTYTIKVPLR